MAWSSSTGWNKDGWNNAAVIAAYTGPGDVASGALGWWGLRAYNAAYATGSNPAIDLVDQAGANPITINILANGKLDVASISTWVTAHTVTTIKVAKLYDQTNNGRPLLQATLANMPTLNLAALNSLPTISFISTTSLDSGGGTVGNLNQPISMSNVMARPSNSASNRKIFDNAATSCSLGWGSPVGSIRLETTAGSFDVTGNAEPNFHAVQTLVNAASSQLYIDGTSTGGPALTGANPIWGDRFVINPGFDSPDVANITEWGFWNLDKSSNFAALNSNQTLFWGPF